MSLQVRFFVYESVKLEIEFKVFLNLQISLISAGFSPAISTEGI